MVPQTLMTVLCTVNVVTKAKLAMPQRRTCGCIVSDFQLSADHNLGMPIMQSMEIPWQCSLSAFTVQLATLINYLLASFTVHPLQICLAKCSLVHVDRLQAIYALCHAVTAAFLLCCRGPIWQTVVAEDRWHMRRGCADLWEVLC